MIRHNILSNQDSARQYINGILRLKDPGQFPWPGQNDLSMYDFFVFWHHRAMMLPTPPTHRDRNAAHSGPVFLPWHRYFLLMLELYLQDAVGDENFRLPYWDWASDADLPDPKTSVIWDTSFMGQFEDGSWRVRLAPNPTGANLRTADRPLDRNFSGGSLPNRSQVREVIQDQVVYDLPLYDTDAAGFRNFLEGWRGPGRLHNQIHVWVGGDMVVSTSPNDPVFFLHHCNVDRIWAAWQKQRPSAAYVPAQSESAELRFHRIDDPMHTFFDHQVTPGMMWDSESWYQYDTFDDLV